jgi:hypothetical protein
MQAMKRLRKRGSLERSSPASPFFGILPGVWPFFNAHLPFWEFQSKMGCLRALCARKQPIFDLFPRPVRGGVKCGVKETAFSVIRTKKAKR